MDVLEKIQIRIRTFEIRRILMVLICIASVGCFTLKGVFAYEFPANASYITINDSRLGEITLYVPKNQAETLALTAKNNVVGTSSSTVNFYLNDSNYTFSVTAYSFIRYRSSGSSSYSYMDNATLVDTNISSLNGNFSFITDNYEAIVFVLLFTISIWGLFSWLKK